MVGKAIQKYPNLLQQIAVHGHEIANHSFTHQRLDQLDAAAIRLELQATTELIHEILPNERVQYFRPPGGRYNQIVVDVTNELGLDILLWDVNAGDYYIGAHAHLALPYLPRGQQRNHNFIAKRVLARAKAGSIILLHNTDGELLKALPIILKGLDEQGYEMVTSAELLRRDSE